MEYNALIDMLSNRNIYTHECMLLTICNGCKCRYRGGTSGGGGGGGGGLWGLQPPPWSRSEIFFLGNSTKVYSQNDLVA